MVATAVVLAACGSSGSSDESTRAADQVTTTVASGETPDATATDPDKDADTDGVTEGDDTGAIVFDDEFCESIPADTFADATGSTITEVKASGGIGFSNDIEWATASCIFDLEDGTNIVFEMLLDPETDEPAGIDLFEKLGEASRADTFSGYEHEDVDGVGDQAVFVADAFDNKLMVTTGDMVFFVNGKDADFETLERPMVEQVATSAFTGLA